MDIDEYLLSGGNGDGFASQPVTRDHCQAICTNLFFTFHLRRFQRSIDVQRQIERETHTHIGANLRAHFWRPIDVPNGRARSRALA